MSTDTLLEARASSGSYYYLNDGLGSVMAVVDSSGSVANRYSYDPYGNALSTSESVANPYRFDGQLLDQATGFYKMGARYYGPTGSRWTQEDALAGFVANPQTLNLYPFVVGNPINFIDPSGSNYIDLSVSGFLGIGGTVGLSFGSGGLHFSFGGGVGLEAAAHVNYVSGNNTNGLSLAAEGCAPILEGASGCVGYTSDNQASVGVGAGAGASLSAQYTFSVPGS